MSGLSKKQEYSLKSTGGIYRLLMFACIVLLLVLALLSVVSAFLGTHKSARMFSSVPLAVFWMTALALLVVGFFKLRVLRKKPGLLLCHLGCVLVLLGALWGSEKSHELRCRYMGDNSLYKGYMQIFEGQRTGVVMSSAGLAAGVLPFEIELRDFAIEYYMGEGFLEVSTPRGDVATLKALVGESAAWSDDLPSLTILRVFRNLKVAMASGTRTVADDVGEGSNPALEVELRLPDGSRVRDFVFPASMMQHHVRSYSGLQLRYEPVTHAGIKDYKSSLAVFDEGALVKEKVIEVNKPLHYGGYDFCQHSYDSELGSYTVLSVVSTTGLWLVYAGYLLLCVGMIWQCWLRHVRIPRAARL